MVAGLEHGVRWRVGKRVRGADSPLCVGEEPEEGRVERCLDLIESNHVKEGINHSPSSACLHKGLKHMEFNLILRKTLEIV